MSATIPCPRCATEMRLISSPGDGPGIFRIIPHACFRFLVAEYWESGVVAALWTSETPGRTGPDGLARQHGAEADRGWDLPPGRGWTYRWQIDLAQVTS